MPEAGKRRRCCRVWWLYRTHVPARPPHASLPTPPTPPPATPAVQLSRASEFYPGSPEGQDRILLVSGTVNQLLTALHLVLSKLKAEPGALRAVQVRAAEGLCADTRSRRDGYESEDCTGGAGAAADVLGRRLA